MILWIEVPHGEFLVRVDPELWRTVRLTWAFRGWAWGERAAEKTEALLEPIDFLDFLFLTTACPCPTHQDEMARELGLNP